MSGKRKKKEDRPIFDSVRKPTAPPGKKLGDRRPEEKIHPTGRRTKHKGSKADERQDGDI